MRMTLKSHSQISGGFDPGWESERGDSRVTQRMCVKPLQLSKRTLVLVLWVV